MDPLPGSRVGDWKGLKNEVKDAPRAFRFFYTVPWELILEPTHGEQLGFQPKEPWVYFPSQKYPRGWAKRRRYRGVIEPPNLAYHQAGPWADGSGPTRVHGRGAESAIHKLPRGTPSPPGPMWRI